MPNYAKTDHYTPDENDFWERFCACAGVEFETMRGLKFTFRVRGNEVFFDRKAKSITRATIVKAYQQAKYLVANNIPLKKTKQLSTFGASYLLPVLVSLGVLPTSAARKLPPIKSRSKSAVRKAVKATGAKAKGVASDATPPVKRGRGRPRKNAEIATVSAKPAKKAVKKLKRAKAAKKSAPQTTEQMEGNRP